MVLLTAFASALAISSPFLSLVAAHPFAAGEHDHHSSGPLPGGGKWFQDEDHPAHNLFRRNSLKKRDDSSDFLTVGSPGMFSPFHPSWQFLPYFFFIIVFCFIFFLIFGPIFPSPTPPTSRPRAPESLYLINFSHANANHLPLSPTLRHLRILSLLLP